MNAQRHLIFLLCAMWSSTGFPQTFTPASDVDLTASYCLGVVQQQVVGAAAFAAKLGATDARTSQLMSEHQQALQDRLNRLRAYIIPKVQYTDPVALTLSRSRGEADYATLMAVQIPQECSSPDRAKAVECGTTVVHSTPAWKRIDRCTALEFLPF